MNKILIVNQLLFNRRGHTSGTVASKTENVEGDITRSILPRRQNISVAFQKFLF